jgi:antitoxin ParD1/3/4
MSENNTVQNTTLNVSLPEPLKDYAQERVSEGIYSNPSDYVRSLIRDDMRQSAQRRLEAYLLVGLNSGDPTPMDAAEWKSIRQEVQERIDAKSRPA